MVQSPLELDVDRAPSRADRDWICDCVGKIEADFNRSSDTHLTKVALPCLANVDLPPTMSPAQRADGHEAKADDPWH